MSELRLRAQPRGPATVPAVQGDGAPADQEEVNRRHRRTLEERAEELAEERNLTYTEAYSLAYEEFYAEMEHRWEAKNDR